MQNVTLARSLAPILAAATLLWLAGCAENLAPSQGQIPSLTSSAASGLPRDARPSAHPPRKPGGGSQERIALQLSEGLSLYERTKVLTAINDWNVALNGVIRFVVVVDVIATDNQAPGTRSFWHVRVVRGSTGPQSSSGTPLAVTFPSWLGNGVVAIYADNLKTNDLAAVMRHELGHVLGLKHDVAGLMAAQYSSWDMQCIDRRTMSVLAARRRVPVSAFSWCD